MEFIITNIDKLTNSVGLIFDICGAILVAWEVVQQFHGEKIEGGEMQCGNIPARESLDYRQWENKKYIKMKMGLTLLLIGFTLQVISNWIK